MRRDWTLATHSPVLMAYPNAALLQFTKYGLEPRIVEQTDHYKALGSFRRSKGVVKAAIEIDA